MNKFIVSIAMAGLAFSGMAGIASAQQYPYPNQGYPNQNQRYPEHRHHHRNNGYGYNANGQQCSPNGYGYNNGGYNNGGYNNGGYNNGGQCVTLRGTIVGVNGNQVTLRVNGRGNGYGYGRDNDGDNDDNGGYNNGGYNNGGYYNNGNGRQITINDQPALNNQTSGRVSVGRTLTAYGYWQNGVFYATAMN